MSKIAFPLCLAFAATFAASLSSASEIYRCSFTEPFVSIAYDSASGTLTTSTPDSYQMQPDGIATVVPVVENGVSFKVVSAGKFELVKSDGTTLYELELTNNGSDGMSDTTYPFDVRAKTADMMPMDYLGGCSSTTLRPTENP